MSLVTGARLGPYEITAAIGAGGMGEVYRARDTRLDRTVAIKVLSPQLAADPQFRERFEREARAISQLTHPHICTVHDVGEHERTAFLVMEHLEGETLADRLKKGPLPIEQALQLAIEIAAALETAHRHDIVHRDLKPGNIMLTKSGVKLLDFGLAKVGAAAVASGGLATEMQTIAPLTAQGTILGTLQYMAPEQLEGAEADARSDIFAFGAVLYEILTGRRAFEGKTQASLIGSILKDDPPRLSQVLAVPPALDHLVRTCLAKNPEDRFQSAHDVLLQLRWAREAGSDTGAAPVSRSRRTIGWRGAATGIVVAAAIAGAAGWALKAARSEPRPVTRFTIPVGSGESRSGASSLGLSIVALTRDGTRLAYAAGPLFLRQMDQTEATLLRGTETGADLVFSPDGQSLAFYANGMLNRVAVAGGAVVPICPVTGLLRGTTWPGTDRILFAHGTDGISEVSPSGGPARTVVSVERGELARGPQLLPDGETVLFTLNSNAAQDWRTARAVVQSLRTGKRKIMLEGATDSRYVESGHLIFARDSTVLAIPFDPVRYEVHGTPTPVIERVVHNTMSGISHFAVAPNGTLAYVPAGSNARTLVWFDRKGAATPVPAPPRAYGQARLSPDGKRAIVNVGEQDRDLWMWDFARQALTRFTFSPDEENGGIWTPDGASILFASGTGAERGVYSRPANGAGAVVRLARDPDITDVLSATRDGVVLTRSRTGGASGLSSGSWRTESVPRPLAGFDSAAGTGRLSPNGRWLAYQANESGRWEIYVRPFSALEQGRWQVSVDGGHNPEWRADGRELFFGDQYQSRLMSVSVETDGATFSAGRPVALFPINWFFEYGWPFDVSRDGQRFLMTRQNEPAASKIQVVLNWTEELKRRVPTR